MTTAAEPRRESTVRLVVQDQTERVPFTSGLTVAGLLQSKGVVPNGKNTVSVNGEPVRDPRERTVRENDLVVVTPKVANG
ncbi:MAG: hypothetical protein A2939_02860 [Parcubacteria group bacterium RIFCSPLOWO2_01_FULL_48_18]|nr:MAG: hypothetical protein A2939_02860 [Parcubacteria group bacterium RIFCSPLOWO2_01_FULL_48_18]OHB23024.1 MAG: hypothetical protein A3J67_04010 [Parcubacteria group bacterium RIFCSPHIGHO2_02_FULL_48_10b]